VQGADSAPTPWCVFYSCFRLERRLRLAAAAKATGDDGGDGAHTAAEKRLAAGFNYEAVVRLVSRACACAHVSLRPQDFEARARVFAGAPKVAEYDTLFATGVTGMAAQRFPLAQLRHAFRHLLRGGHCVPTQPFRPPGANPSFAAAAVSADCAPSIAALGGVRLSPAIDLDALQDVVKRHSSGTAPAAGSSSGSGGGGSSSSSSSSDGPGPFSGCGVELLRWSLRTAETA